MDFCFPGKLWIFAVTLHTQLLAREKTRSRYTFVQKSLAPKESAALEAPDCCGYGRTFCKARQKRRHGMGSVDAACQAVSRSPFSIRDAQNIRVEKVHKTRANASLQKTRGMKMRLDWKTSRMESQNRVLMTLAT